MPEPHTNFALLQFPGPEAAARADAALRRAGILARGMGGYGLDDCLRITVGGADVMARLPGLIEETLT